MKKLLLTVLGGFLIGSASAQIDTVLYEGFDVDPTASYLPFNSGNDTQWVNFDADAMADANGRPQNWFYSDGAFADVDSVDGCLFSSSWLAAITPPNRNWLMTPPITVTSAGYTLSWASAPRQTPRYVDGYTVLVSTTDNIETSFTDTIFLAAQFISGTGPDFSTYTFSPGFVHGMDGTYTQLDATSDSSRLVGVLRPFSVSLSQYAGQTIYIAFLHDADDDNLIALDDILITETTTGINEVSTKPDFSVYPNPANDKLTLSYELKQTSPVQIAVYDSKGSLVMNQNRGMQIAGSQKLTIDLNSLAAGTYSLSVTGKDLTVTQQFVKN